MFYSKLFGKTTKQIPSDLSTISAKLLFQAGFFRESTAGRYFILPLGQRVQLKIIKIIKEEMDASGAQEMISPLLHPLSLWKETNRDQATGYELMTVKDRHQFEFALGGTAEEMFVDVVRKFQLSYKDLPFNVYQFSTKFRDELRVRGGLLRAREFVMKDAYSFAANEQEFKQEYEKMAQTYTRIFQRLGLTTYKVESDNGYIGGEYCHEFIVESPAGESKFLITQDGSYAAHEDIAVFLKEKNNSTEKELPLQEVPAKRGKTMQDGVNFHQLPLKKHIKNVLFVSEKKQLILASIRGDYDINPIKLRKLVKCHSLRLATNEEIRNKFQSEPGFISPLRKNTHLLKNYLHIADTSLIGLKNACSGGNRKNWDYLNINIDRDFKPDIIGDIALAKAGYVTLSGQPLEEKRGIEVGNIFQLGYHYSLLMQNAVFTDKDGKKKPYYMGCYGIGIGRSMAAIVEKHHDQKGIIWPQSVAPFLVHLIGLNLHNSNIRNKVNHLYQKLRQLQIEVLVDDRLDVSAGEKLADADLIGIPYRLVISQRAGDKIEIKKREEKKAYLTDEDKILTILPSAATNRL
jgi:prolyl-tRNA synthetase